MRPESISSCAMEPQPESYAAESDSIYSGNLPEVLDVRQIHITQEMI